MADKPKKKAGKNQVVKKSLAQTHRALTKEADGWDANNYTAGSNKKMSWKCSLNHKWEASIAKRAIGKGCPYCANRKILPGYNDLKTTHPEIAQQANGWDTTTVVAGSGKKFEWQCSNGHIWKASVLSRKQGKGCSICSGHRVMEGANDLRTTHPQLAKEAFGWDATKYSAGSNYEFEWMCPKKHRFTATIYSRSIGFNCPICSNRKFSKGENDLKTLHPRIAAEALNWDASTVKPNSYDVKEWKCSKGHIWVDAVIDRTNGSDCHVCSGRKIIVGINDLLTKNPTLAAEADGWDVTQFSHGSNKSMPWKCQHGHKWNAPISNRSGGRNCPYCSGMKVLSGFNDVKALYPNLATEAVGWDTTKFTAGSNSIRLWQCQMGHQWKASIANRVSGRGCPSCAKTSFDPNADGILYLLFHPIWMVYKVGISNSSNNRTEHHESNGWEVLEKRGPMDGLLAYEWEQSILKMLKRRGAEIGRSDIAGKFDGYTESWVAASFPVNSIKQLMKLVEVDED